MYDKSYRISLPTILACIFLLIGASKTTETLAQQPVKQQMVIIEPVATIEPAEQIELHVAVIDRNVPIVTAVPVPSLPLMITARPTAERMREPLVRAAGNYAVLMGNVNRIPTEEFRSPDHMNETMDGLLQVFSPSLGPSLIGYGALIGAQNSDFVEGVLETARHKGIDSVVYQLYVNPNYAASLPGAFTASSDIQASWANDIAAMERSSQHVRSQSYSMQKQKKWKKRLADSRTERLEIVSNAKTLHFDPPHMMAEQIAEVGTIRANDATGDMKRHQFWQAYGREDQPQTEDFTWLYQSKMHRKALTLSALEILGATSAESSEWIEKYMTSPRLNQCINTARLNTEQCIAAVHFKYEDAFCISAHELKEVSICLTKNAL